MKEESIIRSQSLVYTKISQETENLALELSAADIRYQLLHRVQSIPG